MNSSATDVFLPSHGSITSVCTIRKQRSALIFVVLAVVLTSICCAGEQERTAQVYTAWKENDEALFNKLISDSQLVKRQTGTLASLTTDVSVPLNKSKTSHTTISFIQLDEAKTPTGSVLRMFNTSGKSVSLIFVGNKKFGSEATESSRSMFIYMARKSMGGKLTLNTYPPRRTEAWMRDFMEKKTEAEKLANLQKFNWAGDAREKWVVNAKNGKRLITYEPLSTTVRNGKYEVYGSGTISFVQAANAKIDNLWENRKDRYGTENQRGPGQTNCFIFTGEVLEDAFRQTGDEEASKFVNSLYVGNSWEPKLKEEPKLKVKYWDPNAGPPGQPLRLTKFLQEKRNWKVYYWNFDVEHPWTNDQGHKIEYKEALVDRTYMKSFGAQLETYLANNALREQEYNKYFNSPWTPFKIDGFLVDFRPTPGQKTAKRTAAMNRFRQHVKFAYGFAIGGLHSFLIKDGTLTECHWEGRGDDANDHSLYDRDQLFDSWQGYKNGYLSGVLVVPPEVTTFVADMNPPPVTVGGKTFAAQP